MSKDYAVVFLNEDDDSVVSFQRMYEEEAAEKIAREYVKPGQYAIVLMNKSMWSKPLPRCREPRWCDCGRKGCEKRCL